MSALSRPRTFILSATMAPRPRKFVLTAHVASSIGWLGAVAGFLALAVAGVASGDAQMVRAADIAMRVLTWLVIVPLALASLVTGLVSSLGTRWGLFRHYWVLIKLLLTLFATLVLLLQTRPIDYLAGIAAKTTLSNDDLGRLRSPELVVHAAGGLVVLLVATVLSIYEPRGRTRYGWRRLHEQRAASAR